MYPSRQEEIPKRNGFRLFCFDSQWLGVPGLASPWKRAAGTTFIFQNISEVSGCEGDHMYDINNNMGAIGYIR